MSYQPLPLENVDEDTRSDDSSCDLQEVELVDMQTTDSITIKLLTQPQPRVVRVSLEDTIMQVKNVHMEQELKEGNDVIFMYLGKVLRNSHSVKECMLQDGCAIHVHISPPLRDPSAPPAESVAVIDGDSDIGLSLYDIEGQLRHHDAPEESRTNTILTGAGGFVFGFMLGSFLGIISLIWLWQTGVPRSQKLGVMFGLLANLFYQMQQIDAVDNTTDPGDSGDGPIDHDDGTM